MEDESIDGKQWANLILCNTSEERVNAIVAAINQENSQPGDRSANVILACCHVLGEMIVKFEALAPEAKAAVLSLVDKSVEIAMKHPPDQAGTKPIGM